MSAIVLSAALLPASGADASVAAGASAGLAFGRAGSDRSQDGSSAVAEYVSPVPSPLRVVRRFDPPASRYGPGHRGVDLGVGGGQLVRSPADGIVIFAGPVAGRGVVVVRHPDGISTEYEPVTPLVHRGDPVHQGDPLARLSGTDAGCARPNCLHWGARRAGNYIDPLSLLAPLGPVRLLPWSGPAR